MQLNGRILRRYLLLLVTAGVAGTSGAQTTQQLSAALFNAPEKKLYDEDARSWYSISTTNGVVQVYLAVTDPVQQQKIIMNGIELWIDGKGKKNKKTGISFPFTAKGSNNRPDPATAAPGSGSIFAANPNTAIPALEKIISLHHEMKLEGFKEELNGVQNSRHASGIQVCLYFVKDTLVYQAQLPLNTLSEPPLVNSRVAVGIIEKGMPVGLQAGGDMPPADGDGMMPPPGPPPAGGEDGMRIFEDSIIWYKFLL